MGQVDLASLVATLDAWMQSGDFNDYCPNGLQVQACDDVATVVSGVTASLAMIEAAIAAKADVLLVHHGFFWRADSPVVVGMHAQRMRLLFAHNISLIAYHLPLDAHMEYGNNVLLGQKLGLIQDAMLDWMNPPIGCVGKLAQQMSGQDFAAHISKVLQREPLHIVGVNRPISKIAWCSGAAQDGILAAHAVGADAYISGEISERTVHIAKELGIDYFACGHHATERYGICALGEAICEKFGIVHEFINIDNPV